MPFIRRDADTAHRIEPLRLRGAYLDYPGGNADLGSFQPLGGVPMTSDKYDSTEDTIQHVEAVRQRLNDVRDNLMNRGWKHDLSKLESPEKETFDEVTPKLKGLTYGSDEYRAALKEMKAGIDHHYANNNHHPEHWQNGIDDMSLLDVLEMFCDWKAAGERVANGDFAKSLEINKARFGISDQLANILENTRKEMGW